MVANYVSRIVGQLGASTFQMCKVVPNVIVEPLKGLWEAFGEGIMDMGVVIVRRKMAEQMVFAVVDGVQVNEVDANGVMEILKVDTEA